jgi:hypothetical protein
LASSAKTVKIFPEPNPMVASSIHIQPLEKQSFLIRDPTSWAEFIILAKDKRVTQLIMV